jgi:hypothetical protein
MMWTIKARYPGQIFAEVRSHPQFSGALDELLHDYKIRSARRNRSTTRIEHPRSLLDWTGLVFCPPALRDLVFEYFESCVRPPIFKKASEESQKTRIRTANLVLGWIEDNMPSALPPSCPEPE